MAPNCEIPEVHVLSSDDEQAALPIADETATQQIVDYLEWCLSDERLFQDEFMLDKLRENKLGLVNLTLVQSYFKLKNITLERMAYAIRVRSSKLEVTENDTKLRRKQPYKEVDCRNKNHRTIYVANLPGSNLEQFLNDLSAQFGEIDHIHLFKEIKKAKNHQEILEQARVHVAAFPEDGPIVRIVFCCRLSATTCFERRQQLYRVWQQIGIFKVTTANNA